MSGLKVAYLGPRASYTHQAAIKCFDRYAHSLHLEPRTTIEDVFAAVQDGEVDRAVVPFENSTNGSVVFTLDLFANLNAKYSDILIIDEIYLSVHHCLLGRVAKDDTTLPVTNGLGNDVDRPLKTDPTASTTTALPSSESSQGRHRPRAPIKHITKLYSHPQAWGQCKEFLSTHMKGVERQDASSTSRAAELAAADDSGTSAAISSRLAAELTGLDILAEGLQDDDDNSTRFLVLQHASKLHSPTSGTNTSATVSTPRYKTLVSFTIDHTSPGALADALWVFKKYSLNLTSINTRPSGHQTWTYIFFVEFWGGKGADGQAGVVDEALTELKSACNASRWLGSWESAEEVPTQK